MQKLTQEGQTLVTNLSSKYNISQDAVIHMIIAVNNGGGSMAQFNVPELGGSGQWMRGGMTMVGDMFNNGLKNSVDNLCSEIANALSYTQVFPLAPPGTRESNEWWPTELALGTPFSSGAQNNLRYAVFANRLAIDLNGEVSVYDTLDNNINGVSQQQGGDYSLTFSSQYGTIAINSLPLIYGKNTITPPVQTNFAQATQTFTQPTVEQPIVEQATVQTASNSDEIIDLIEKLSKLHSAGILSDSEFETKKSELIARI